MSQIFKSLFVVFLTCSALLAAGQSKADKALQKKILGKWEYLKMEAVVGKDATEEEKSMAQLTGSFGDLLSLTTYTFNKNGSFEQSQNDTESTGTWKIENESLLMSGGDDNSQPVPVTILKDILTMTTKVSDGLTVKLLMKRK